MCISWSSLSRSAGFPKIAYLIFALILGVTGWIYLDHGLSVGWVNFGYVTVRKSVAGGAFAGVGIGSFSIGTGVGVKVRLFFTAGGIGILRVTVTVLFCSAARVVRGYSVAWPLLLEARAWLFDRLSVSLSCSHFAVCLVLLLCWPWPPGRGYQVRG